MTEDLSSFLAAMDLRPDGRSRWRGSNTGDGHGVLFGGQLLGQTIAAAALAVPDKQVRSVHTLFARGGQREQEVTLSVAPLHEGRSFASVEVSVSQGERICCRSLVLLDAPDPDLVRHEVPAPAGAPPAGDHDRWWQVEVVGGVELTDPTVGPAELAVWSRMPGLPTDDPTLARAGLAYASDGFLIGTAMRPHPGLDQSMAHVAVATTVLAHTITFHGTFPADGWLLLSQESIHAGEGRAHGRAVVHTADGRHVASFSQDSMLRAMPDRG